MIVDLNKIDFRHIKELITWCIANDIDKKQAANLLFAWYEKPLGEGTLFGEKIVWELDIPSEHLTYWLLRWQ